jgi:hypothetical protein
VSEVTLNSAVQQARQNQLTEADAASLGDLFEYKMKEPITIRRGQSALVPILSSEITAEKVSLWNFDTGAHSRRAVRAFWLTNSTGMTLDGGSFSIVEGRAFAGEGLMDPIKAGERRLLSYAVDLGLTLDWSEEARPTRTSTVKVLNGTLVLRSEEQRRRTYTARNQDAERKVLVIEHRKDDEFTVVSETKPVESTADFHRFRVTIEPNATATLVVDEVRPTETTFRVADMMDAHVEFLVSTKAMSPGLEAGLKEVLARKADVARLTAEGARRRTEIDQITKDQERLRENMKSLKGSAEERQLLQRYVRQLNEQENRIEALRGEAQAIAGQIEKARAELVRAIEAVR